MELMDKPLRNVTKTTQSAFNHSVDFTSYMQRREHFRTRNMSISLDQDIQHLRASREDNPYIQKIISSREDLLDNDDDSSDNSRLMAKDYLLDIDPLSLPDVQDHMIRSPPPLEWPHSSNYQIFQFPIAASACHKTNSLPNTKALPDGYCSINNYNHLYSNSNFQHSGFPLQISTTFKQPDEESVPLISKE